jgi:hypothetical protein
MKIGSPRNIQRIPPSGQFFVPAYFSGVYAYYFEFLGTIIQVDFDKSGFGVSDFFPGKGRRRNCLIQGSEKVDLPAFFLGGLHFPDFEFKLHVFVKELNVFEIRSNIFVGDYFPVKEEIVFDLDFFISKNLEIAFTNDNILIPRGSFMVAHCVEKIF